jgi:ABC-type sugar transport system ATPase subunit
MSSSSETGDLLLQVRDVVKTFPGVRALDGVSFDLRRGEVHALVGENGAGKSTLMHVLAGVYPPDSGMVCLDGQTVRFPDTHSAFRHGISVVFQELSLSENLSIAENVFANRQPVGRLGFVDWQELYRRTKELLRRFDWEMDPQTPVRNLSSAKQQVVEILKALSQRPRVLILDEPTSSLTAVETRLLFENVRRLKREGMSCIYISHHLDEVFELADRVTVLRDGRRVDTCGVAEVTEAELVRKMVGRELADMYGRRVGEIGGERFRLENGRREGVFADVSFAVRQGEIVGMAGLAGAGRTELGRAIFGAERLDGGRMDMEGRRLSIGSPADAIASRIAYMTENRKEDGLFLDMTIRENLAAPHLAAFADRFGLMDESAMTDFARNGRTRFNIVASGVWQRMGLLSGGNQQKTLLAMWMGAEPLLLIADEPTRGVDVGARSEIYHLLRDMAKSGMAILLISSDLPEILGLSDRILVMRNGRLAGEFAREVATEENIIACAAGVGEGSGKNGDGERT